MQDSQVLGKCPHPHGHLHSAPAAWRGAGACPMARAPAMQGSSPLPKSELRCSRQGRVGQGCRPAESAPQGSTGSVLVPTTAPKSKPSGLPLRSAKKSPSGTPLLSPGKSHLGVGLFQRRLPDQHTSCCHRRHEGRPLRAPPHPRYAPRTTGALYAAQGPDRREHKGQPVRSRLHFHRLT